MNKLGKLLLASTSLSPVLFIVAVNQFERHISAKLSVKPAIGWLAAVKSCIGWPVAVNCGIGWLAAAIILIILCRWLLGHFSKKAGKHLLHIHEFERKDQEMLVFLFIYMLPFIRSGDSTFASEWITSICLLVILILAITHARAFHFNPVMGFFGYHFYAIKDSHGVSNLLISKKDLRRPNKKVQTVQLTSNVYIQTDYQ